MILSSFWYHSGILGFLHVKFIVDFRTMVMACSGHQFGLCRWFTYRTIIPPTVGNTEKGVKQGKSSYPLLSMKKDQANKTNVERVYRWWPLVWEPGLNRSSIDLQLVQEWA